MSKHEIPFHIQEEIMKRLAVKSLLQFRTVSKTWKSLIDSSDFINAHTFHRHSQQHHLLASYENPMDETHYVSFIDDDTLPQQRSIHTLPPFLKQLTYPRVAGSSHGLFCLYGSNSNFTTKMVVLWNPSIRKLVVVDTPNKAFVGFGVCPITKDPKIVSITKSSDVTVYTLNTGKWRSPSNNWPTTLIRYPYTLVVTDSFIYWRVGLTHNMIMSFHLTNEKFEVIDLPDSLARRDFGNLFTSKLRGSLAILQYRDNIFTIWMMDHGVEISFTKLFTIETPHFVIGFRNSGVPIMQVTNDDGEQSKVVVYEPKSKHNNVLETSDSHYSFYVNAYMETLLLQGRSDCISY